MGIRANNPTGLILSGGGARAAYQVGVLGAISEILPEKAANPFDVISGTSAGALNAAALAAGAWRFSNAVRRLEMVWKNLSSDQVYNLQSGNLLTSASTVVLNAMSGKAAEQPRSILDNAPLGELLKRVISFRRIQRNIDLGLLDAVSITSSAYGSGESVSFYQAMKGINDWHGPHRIGLRTKLTLDHLLASSALPLLFPAVKIGTQFYGDGAVRQLAPTSTALHLGARRLLVIGVSGNKERKADQELPQDPPGLMHILGHIMNSAFVDTLENDLESLRHMNDLIPFFNRRARRQIGYAVHEVELLEISPSRELNQLAQEHYAELPKALSSYIKPGGAGTLLSLVLFEQGFCSALYQLGYDDAMAKADDIRRFFHLS